jgi:hypothetical protein
LGLQILPVKEIETRWVTRLQVVLGLCLQILPVKEIENR